MCNRLQRSYMLQLFTQNLPHQTPNALLGAVSAVNNRFEEAIAAAKAYDKAAVYLYGASAITNFGLEACLAGKWGSRRAKRILHMHTIIKRDQQHCWFVQIEDVVTCSW
jgi:hypothetical protein